MISTIIKAYLSFVKASLALEIRKPDLELFTNNLDLVEKVFIKFLLLDLAILALIFALTILLLALASPMV